MRDPSRIDEILTELREIWLAHPDLRLGQLVLNAAANPRGLEDSDLIAEMRRTFGM